MGTANYDEKIFLSFLIYLKVDFFRYNGALMIK